MCKSFSDEVKLYLLVIQKSFSEAEIRLVFFLIQYTCMLIYYTAYDTYFLHI